MNEDKNDGMDHPMNANVVRREPDGPCVVRCKGCGGAQLVRLFPDETLYCMCHACGTGEAFGSVGEMVKASAERWDENE